MIRLAVRFGLLALLMLCGAAKSDTFGTLLNQGESYRQTHQYHKAIDTLLEAGHEAQTPQQKAQLDGALGHTYYYTHQTEAAESRLRVASENPVLPAAQRANYANLLGSLYAGQNRTEAATQAYQKAWVLAGDDRGLDLSIRLNQIRLLPIARQLAPLNVLATDIAALPESVEQARLYLYVGEQARSLGDPALQLSFEALDHARRSAGRLHQERLLIEATMALGGLYEAQNRTGEALHLTQEALRLAQSGQEHDLLMNLEWQQGRLFRKQQQWTAAREAFQRAVEHIEAIRGDIPIEYHDGRSSFRETLSPLYLGLVDLLLLEARQSKSADISPVLRLLRQARGTVELLKQSELEDFLGDRCLIASTRNAGPQQLAADTAVLYPIILPDRLELLLDLNGNIQQFTVTVTAKELESTAQALVKQLRGGRSQFQKPSEQLYRWLIAPLDKSLREAGVHTLVTIPDGVLRMVPMSALYDGKHYLIERYAIATSPALSVLNAAGGRPTQFTMLLAGLSEPGGVVEKLPWSMLKNVISTNLDDRVLARGDLLTGTRSLTGGLRGMGPAFSAMTESNARQVLRNPALRGKIKEALSLPGVKLEIGQLQGEMSNTLLFNESFTVDSLKQKLHDGNYPFIHIASHGVFGHNAETTFIMAYDDVIRIDTLQSLLKASARQQAPVELLTLSACETAEGDDRAPLGLSGVALRARARSALGTLWPINDEAAYTLMTNFYRYLKEPGVGKAEALRRAQLELIKKPAFKHPYYWSPFILVGNWL